MITVSQRVGRLIEIRMTAPITAEEIAAMQRDTTALVGKITGRAVICADLAGITILASDLADLVAKFFRPDHPRVERSAVFTGESATFLLQIERLLRGASTSGRGSDPLMTRRTSERRAFRAAADAIAWLDEVLTPEERARVRLFLEAPPPRTSIF